MANNDRRTEEDAVVRISAGYTSESLNHRQTRQPMGSAIGADVAKEVGGDMGETGKRRVHPRAGMEPLSPG